MDGGREAVNELQINKKNHGRNICLFGKGENDMKCRHSFKESPKLRTCFCTWIGERVRCKTECDGYKGFTLNSI